VFLKADVDAAVEELSFNASRIHNLKIFYERGIHLDPSFYMLGWVLSQADLYLFQRNPRDSTLRHLANNGRSNPNEPTLEFLHWAWEQLQQKDATNLFCIIENFYCNQPWKLMALTEQEYWVLFFYAFAHAVYAEP
jgi:membrane associated rhomboid family serine protease